VKPRPSVAVLILTVSILPLGAAGDEEGVSRENVILSETISGQQNAIRREASHIEQAADELMELILDVPSRPLRRKMAAEVDEVYEAAERIKLLVSQTDTVPKPIRAEDLQEFLTSLANASFSDTKVDMVAEFAKSNWFTIDQVGLITEEVSFGDDKVETIVVLYSHIVDPENNYRLFEFLTFSDDREKLKLRLAEIEKPEE
jgi:hypothetical protein